MDIGSSSVRSSLYDADANVIAGAFAKIERSLAITIDGGSEIDACEAFDHVVAAIDAVLKKSAKLKREIGYVATSSFWHSLIGVDAKGKPTTKVFGWADTRSGKYTEVLRKKFDETKIHDRTGARFHSSYWSAKLLWLRNEFPDVFAKTARWMSFSDFVALRLFNEDVTSVSMASATGIFDIRKCTWDAKLLKYLKVRPSNLPAIVDSDSTTFNLNQTFIKRWPRLANAQWFTAIGDGAADNIGAGCTKKTHAALMIGTSGAMRVAYTGEPPAKIPKGLWCYRIDRKRVIGGGALSDGGNLLQWLKSNLKLPKDFETQIAKRIRGAHGITFLPFFHGERGTGYNENAKAAIVGLTASHDSIDILQAAMESVAYRFAEIFDRLNKVAKVSEIVASGGALRDSPVWTQIIADVLDRDLKMNRGEESSSRGAVIFALEQIETIMNIKIAPTAGGRTIKADRDRFTAYKMARKRHADLYKILIQ